jgi:hypothetical protein
MTMPTNEPAPEPQQASPSQELVEYKNRLEAENKQYRTQLVGTYLGQIGLTPDTGLGKAIAQTYKGDISAEAVASFAYEEYGHQAPAPPQPATPPAVQQAVQAQQAATQLGSVAQPLAPQSQIDRLAAHDQRLAEPDSTRRDAEVAIADKTGALLERMFPNQAT